MFQSEICRQWEAAALRCADLGVRCGRCCDSAYVLGTGGGRAACLACARAKLGLAAVMGTGKQGFPWIHIEERHDGFGSCGALNHDVEGPVNAVAPELVSPRAEFTVCPVRGAAPQVSELRRFRAWPVRWALGEMSQLLLDGQFVKPTCCPAVGILVPSSGSARRDGRSAGGASPGPSGRCAHRISKQSSIWKHLVTDRQFAGRTLEYVHRGESCA